MPVRFLLPGSLLLILTAHCATTLCPATLEAADPAAPPVVVAKPTPEQVEFFEKQIRPLLAGHCYQCHSAKKQESGLRLDLRSPALAGGDTGPLLTAGQPDKSLLVEVLSYDGDIQMPPAGKLPDEAIARVREWVAQGAPWPIDPDAPTLVVPTSPEGIAQARGEHWAFQPVGNPQPPELQDSSWAKSPIDRFLLKRLQAEGIEPSTQADKRTLIRRATFDLHGLPPTYQEVQQFLADEREDAFARLVDRLLSSPRYGQRWARHWLDVARYADTKGYVFQEERRYPFSYTYRDYVVRALNEDLPYDQFLIEQLAADQLELGDDKRPLAAMGFLTLGRRFLNNIHDVIDDRIDVVMRGTQALTVGCARCHDHKFDPIPTADYYSLYGVFLSSEEPGELPQIGEPEPSPAYDAYRQELAKRQQELEGYLAQMRKEQEAAALAKSADYLLLVDELQRQRGANLPQLARERGLLLPVISRWRQRIGQLAKPSHPVLGPWQAFAALKQDEFKDQAGAIVERIQAANDGPGRVNPRVAARFKQPPASLADVAQSYQGLLAELAGKRDHPPDADAQEIVEVFFGQGAPLALADAEVESALDRPKRNKVRELRKQVDEHRANSAAAPPRAMVLVDRPNPIEPQIFQRGNPGRRGDRVPRQYLVILAGEQRQPFGSGSGRLELARAIASRDNPLTARVMVNRVWQHHFGEGLVRTASNFGAQGEQPTHHQLLDYLARQFMDEGWSLKQLHRRLMVTAAYMQSSATDARRTEIDAENRLVWRFNRQRLDFEALRDSLLTVGRGLDDRLGGRSVDILATPYTQRRTLYGYIDRQNLQSIYRTFDFASPDATSGGRHKTTIPQQALFMMNHPFVVQQADGLLARVPSGDAAARIRQLYRTALSRDPTARELELGVAFVSQPELKPEFAGMTPIWQYGFGRLDEGSAQVAKFVALPHFDGKAYQGGAKLPDPKLGWVLLNNQGGHPGNNPEHLAIRRWTAPADAVVEIAGVLSHGSEQGDGVRGLILSQRGGKLGEWTVHKSHVEAKVERIEIQRGETIDFVVESRGNVNFDSFAWAPVIRTLEAGGGARQAWNARSDFRGPEKPADRLTPWQRYAQVLLLSNEFAFVD